MKHKSRKIILAGGSGFLGQKAAHYFAEGDHEVIVLTRGKPKREGKINYIQWSGCDVGEWVEHLEGAFALINFSGKSINCVHTEKNRQLLRESRISSVQTLLQAVAQTKAPPEVFIQLTALGFFGNTHHRCTEETERGDDFLASLCSDWEEAFFAGELTQTRRVVFRTGLALGKGGGVLPPLVRITKCFLGGTVGNGKQYMSWVHVKDICRMFEFILSRPQAEGIYNTACPQPVTNRFFMKTLRKTFKRPYAPPVPAFAIRLVARFILRTEADLLLGSSNCLPQRLIQEGFQFKYPTLEEALRSI